ncbi:hypothetical protein [uncultured Chitinophaga sp.]|uniref:hypothetical protein n=1 Tax=uncultured Chitinophaga sp. TaxID=339340 RepID=UPI0025DA6290|nr:hypothetical protein [uncultured Chitinophaga sp.]
MQRTTFQNTVPGKCLAFGVYVLFFFVQLHLRYVCIPSYDGMAQPDSYRSAHKQTGAGIYTDGSQGVSKLQVKLNKRYFPTQIYGPLPLQLQFNLAEVVLLLKTEATTVTPALQFSQLTCSLLRGPPSIC